MKSVVVRVCPCPRCEDGMVPGPGRLGHTATAWCQSCPDPPTTNTRPRRHQPSAPICSRLLPSDSAEYCRVVACVVTKYSAQFGPLQPAAGQTGAPRDWSQHLQASFHFNLVFHNLPVYFFIVSYYTYRTNGSKNSRGATLLSCACYDSAIFHM